MLSAPLIGSAFDFGQMPAQHHEEEQDVEQISHSFRHLWPAFDDPKAEKGC